MHYLTCVFIGETNSIEAAVDRALAPFDESRLVPPWKNHLHAGEIADMAANFGVPPDDLGTLAARMPEWAACAGGIDRRGLYALRITNPRGRWDWYTIGGRWQRLPPGNRIRASELLHSPRLEELLPHDFVTPDGRWHSRERPVRKPDGNLGFRRRRPALWLAEFRAALASHPEHLVVFVDRHQ